MVQHIQLISCGSPFQFQVLQLQFITGDITFQGCSLAIGGLHVFYQQTGLFDILLVD